MTGTVLAARLDRALAGEPSEEYLEATVRNFAGIRLADYLARDQQDERALCRELFRGLDPRAFGLDELGFEVRGTADPLQETVGYLCFMIAVMERAVECAQGRDGLDPCSRVLVDEAARRSSLLYDVLLAPILAAARRCAASASARRRQGGRGGMRRSRPQRRVASARLRRAEIDAYRDFNNYAFKLPLPAPQARAMVDIVLFYRPEAMAHAALALAKHAFDRRQPSLFTLVDGFGAGEVPPCSAPPCFVTPDEVTAGLACLSVGDHTFEGRVEVELDERFVVCNPHAVKGFLRCALAYPIATAYAAGAFDGPRRGAGSPRASGPVLASRLAAAGMVNNGD